MQPMSDITQFENKRILVVGDVMLDEFIYATSERNSPEYKEVPVLSVQHKKQYLGGAANVALNIKKLKAIPYLVGTVGRDEAGTVIQELLAKEGITNLYLHTNHRQKTTVKTRVFRDNVPVCRIDTEEAVEYEELVNHFVLKHLSDAITNHKPHAIILQDYNKGVLNANSIPAILALAKQHHLKICVDPKFDNWNLYQDADLFKPNKTEFEFMSKSESESELLKQAIMLQEKIHFKKLLVTLGPEGNFIFDGNTSHISPLISQVSNPDVCGAGDTVIAVAALGITCGFSLEQIAVLSNKAGAIVCQKEHVQPVLIEELVN